MRVTKYVREYIEKEIAKKFPQTPHEEYARVSKLYNEASDEYFDHMRKYAEELRATLNAKYNLPEQWHLRGRKDYGCDYEGTTLVGVDYNCDLKQAERKHRQEIDTKRYDAFNAIIVELELGGNKADLERLLAEL